MKFWFFLFVFNCVFAAINLGLASNNEISYTIGLTNLFCAGFSLSEFANRKLGLLE